MPSEKTNTQSPDMGCMQHARDATQKTLRRTRIPSPVMFLLVVLSSLGISSGLLALTSSIHRDELRSVGKPIDSWWQLGGLLAWRAFEIGLAWLLGYDSKDVQPYMGFIHYPTFVLLYSFYNIRPTAILVTYTITISSQLLPFVLSRPLSDHNRGSRASSNAVSNRSIIQDYPTAIYTTIVATSVFAVALYISFATWLPTHMVLHFENIPDISQAHFGPQILPILFSHQLIPGMAAKQFLFVSSAGAQDDSDSSPGSGAGSKKQQPSSGWKVKSCACAIYRRTWGALTMKRRVLIQRTLTLAIMTTLVTTVQLAGTVQGVDVQGASAWGAIWSVATLITGLVFGWIESVDGF